MKKNNQSKVNVDQIRAWNDYDATHWVDQEIHFNLSIHHHYIHLLNVLHIKPNNTILDIGCGTGETTLDAARLSVSGEVLGLDVSREMLKRAREHAKNQKLNNVTFIEGDAQVYPFPKNHFDIVMSRNGVMFFDDPIAALKNFYQTLKPGGRLLLLVWSGAEKNEWIQIVFEALSLAVALLPPEDPFRFADKRKVRAMLDEVGFIDSSFTAIDEPFIFGMNVNDAYGLARLDWVESRLAGISKTKREEVLKALKKAMKDHETSDGVIFSSGMWLIEAYKPK